MWQRLLCDCMVSSQGQTEVLRMFLEQDQQLEQQADAMHELQLCVAGWAGNPTLQEVTLDHWYPGPGDLQRAELQQWTALTKLYIPTTSNSMAYRLAELTNLESLSVNACSFTDYALLALTALKRLTELRVMSGSLSEELIERLGLPQMNGDTRLHEYYRVFQVSPWGGRASCERLYGCLCRLQ